MKKIYNNNKEKYMPIIDHINELKSRMLISIFVFITISIICLFYTKEITVILQKPALGIKFLQLAPGEYLFVSMKASIYLAIIISTPFTLYQILLFILPGLTKKESRYLIPILLGSISLFFIGTFFSYNFLIPVTLRFLIKYGSDIIEPIWSFEEYFNFVALIIFSTGISFQIPVIQIILGISNMVKWENMLENWKYITFISTILGAVITPSTDPLTQICMTATILLLYFGGIFIVRAIKT